MGHGGTIYIQFQMEKCLMNILLCIWVWVFVKMRCYMAEWRLNEPQIWGLKGVFVICYFTGKSVLVIYVYMYMWSLNEQLVMYFMCDYCVGCSQITDLWHKLYFNPYCAKQNYYAFQVFAWKCTLLLKLF